MAEIDTFKFHNKHPKLAHLSDQCINDLISDYYGGMAVTEIIKKYTLPIKSTSVIGILPAIIDSERKCTYCNDYLIKKLKSRQVLMANKSRDKLFCPKCHHLEDSDCKCVNCRLRQKEHKKSYRLFKDFQISESISISFEELTITDKIYLGSLVDVCLIDSFELNIAQNPTLPIAPSGSLFNEMIVHLLKRNILKIQSGLYESFRENDFLFFNADHFSKYMVSIQNFQNHLKDLLMPNIDIVTNRFELQKIWKAIAIEECIEYLKYSLNYVDFPFNEDEKNRMVFDKQLNTFSISQIFGLIYRSLGYTTTEFQAGKINRSIAGSYLMKAVQNQGDKAKKMNWNLTKYKRPIELPESQLSKFFFRKVLLNTEDESINFLLCQI